MVKIQSSRYTRLESGQHNDSAIGEFLSVQMGRKRDVDFSELSFLGIVIESVICTVNTHLSETLLAVRRNAFNRIQSSAGAPNE